MSDAEPRVEIVPVSDDTDAVVSKSPVSDSDPLAEFKDDKKYRSKRWGPRAALRRVLDRESRVDADERGLDPALAKALRWFDEQHGKGNRRYADDLAILLQSLMYRDNLKPAEVVQIFREITDQTDGPPKETMQHDVTMMAIKTVELPREVADRV